MHYTKRNHLAAAAIIGMSLTFGSMAAQTHLDRSSWSWSASSTDTQDGGGLAAIHDDNAATFWHSNYHDESSHYCPHWIQIDRNKDTTGATGLGYLPRQGAQNNIVTEYRIYFDDKDFRDSWGNINLNSIGAATYAGKFTYDDYEEKICAFTQEHKERFVLFVIDNTAKGSMSNGTGSSTAIAELYLLSGKVQGGSGSGSNYNSVKINVAGGETHRIAMDGGSLTMTMNEHLIRMANSGITVEYEMDEASSFEPEYYEFPEGSLYSGTHTDVMIPGTPFEPVVTPAPGIYPSGTRITSLSVAHPDGHHMDVNSTSRNRITLGTEDDRSSVFNYTASALSKVYDSELRTFNLPLTDSLPDGTYVLHVAPELLVHKSYATTNSMLHVTYQIGEPSGISLPTTDGVSTLAFKVDGGYLHVTGATPGTYATVHSLAGMRVANVPVNSMGTASVAVASLGGHGVYLLTVEDKTFKITI